MEKQWCVTKMWVVAKWMVSDWDRSGLSSLGRNSPSSFCVPSTYNGTVKHGCSGGGGGVLVSISRNKNQSRYPTTDTGIRRPS